MDASGTPADATTPVTNAGPHAVKTEEVSPDDTVADTEQLQAADAEESLLEQLDKNADLPPTQTLSWPDFEDYVLRLLNGERFSTTQGRFVEHAEKYGVPGDKQDGIDIQGWFNDAKTANWQCKRQDRLTAADVKTAVARCKVDADEHFLVYSGLAGKTARDEIKNHPKWRLLDRSNLAEMLNALPLYVRREILDATWGKQLRQVLMRAPGEDAFVTVAAVRALRDRSLLNDNGVLVGRTKQRDLIADAAGRPDGYPVIVVTGPGGHGKTRMVLDAVQPLIQTNPRSPVLVVSDTRPFDADSASELPQVPAVLVADDVHENPGVVRPLLEHVQRIPGTHVILAARTSAKSLLRQEITRLGIPPSQVLTIETSALTAEEATALVEDLTNDLGLPYPVRAYLARQARNAPYLPVMAANLLRRGELPNGLSLDANLRDQVLYRYRDVVVSGVRGADDATLQRVLAVYAAVEPDEDGSFADDIAHLCDLRRSDVLRLEAELRDRAVIVSRAGRARVVPDMLADAVLELAAVAGGHDLGFIDELWNTFKGVRPLELAVRVGELDWRLAQQDGPSIAGRVFTELVEVLIAAGIRLYGAAPQLERLAAAQPARVVDLLDALRASLDTNTVSDQLPGLYAQCALSDPAQLERVLDVLWAMRQIDARPANQNPGGAARVLTDQLADLGAITDTSFPERIVARVNNWLAEWTAPLTGPSPVFALAPLLAKTGFRTESVDEDRLQFNPYTVTPDAFPGTRDAIRTTLLHEATSHDLRRVGPALALLNDALGEPHPQFGWTPTAEQVLAWEDDDLATVAVLATIAETNDNPVVRRKIADMVSWSAELATSPKVRHAALTLLTSLDNQEDDDLADIMLNAFGVGTPSRRGKAVPSIGELAARGEKATSPGDEALHDSLEERHRETRERAERIADDLHADGTSHLLDAIEQVVIDLRALTDGNLVSGGNVYTAMPVINRVITAYADDLPLLVVDLVSRPDGVLDELLHVLLAGWYGHDPAAVTSWLEDYATLRPAARLAVGTMLSQRGCAADSDQMKLLYAQGLADPDPAVHRQFVVAGHPVLRADPVQAGADLVAAGTDPSVARQLLVTAAQTSASWFDELTDDAARALLTVVDLAGWQHYDVLHVAARITHRHPAIAIDHLMGTSPTPNGPHQKEVAAALADHGEVVADWLIRLSHQEIAREPDRRAGAILARSLSEPQAGALEARLPSLPTDALLALQAVLSGLTRWPISHVGLARAFVTRAAEVGDGSVERVLEELSTVITAGPGTGFMTNGVSDELEQARQRAHAAAAAESNEALAAVFTTAALQLDAQAASLLELHRGRHSFLPEHE